MKFDVEERRQIYEEIFDGSNECHYNYISVRLVSLSASEHTV